MGVSVMVVMVVSIVVLGTSSVDVGVERTVEVVEVVVDTVLTIVLVDVQVGMLSDIH